MVLGRLLINSVKAQEKYSNDDSDKKQIIQVRKENIIAQTIIEQLPAIYLYSFSYALPVEFPHNVFMMMMDLKEEEPFSFEVQGQCQQQKINNRIDKLTCRAIAPDGAKINGEVLVPSFNIREIIKDLQ